MTLFHCGRDIYKDFIRLNAATRATLGQCIPMDSEQREGLLLSIWQAITLVGEVRERSDEIAPSELETTLAEAELLLIGVVSEAVQRPDRATRQRRGLRFWKTVHDRPASPVSSVVPFPGLTTSNTSSSFNLGENAMPRAEIQPGELDPIDGKAGAGRPLSQPRNMGIGQKSRFLLFVVMAVLPMIAIQVWHQRDLRDEREGVVRQRVVHKVQQLASEIRELREGARQLLLAIAQLEAVKLPQPEACSALLAKLRSSYPNYRLLGVANKEGRIFCASGPTSNSVVDQPFFVRAIAHDGLTVGNYWVDPVSGHKIIHFAQQFDDNNDRLSGVVFAGMDLVWLADHLKEQGLAPTSSKLIADREGNIIARVPHPEKFVGQNMRRSHEGIMDGAEAGWEEVVGVDGITRIFAYVPPALSPRDFFLSIGEAKTESFEPINGAMRHDFTLILAGLLASICVAWAGKELVHQPAHGRGLPLGRLSGKRDDLAIHQENVTGSDEHRFIDTRGRAVLGSEPPRRPADKFITPEAQTRLAPVEDHCRVPEPVEDRSAATINIPTFAVMRPPFA